MTWEEFNKVEQNKPYYIKLQDFLDKEYSTKNIFPTYENIFNAEKLCPINNIKVVLVGQDPYQTPGYAMGLSFSVNDNIVIPRSLCNIFKELNNELDINIPKNGNLTKWANNGVLLLNRILTVEEGKPLSHKGIGWEEYTLSIIKMINNIDRKIVFILMGKEAIKLNEYLNNPKHKVLCCAHPSPLSANRGFFNSNIFIDTIKYLNLDKSFWEL